MDVKTRPTTQQEPEAWREAKGEAEGEGGDEAEGMARDEAGGMARDKAGGMARGEAGHESVAKLELRLNKRMDDGFALRDKTICLLAARVKELEQDTIQKENWSFQFGELGTGYASGGNGRDDDADESPSTLDVMTEAVEKLNKEVAEKVAADLAAAENAATDKVGYVEETRPKRSHKPSRPLRSPYQSN